jgi:hypothetical protein
MLKMYPTTSPITLFINGYLLAQFLILVGYSAVNFLLLVPYYLLLVMDNKVIPTVIGGISIVRFVYEYSTSPSQIPSQVDHGQRAPQSLADQMPEGFRLAMAKKRRAEQVPQQFINPSMSVVGELKDSGARFARLLQGY